MRNQHCSDDCELNHCPKCGSHTLGRLESFQQCDECQLIEEANERAEANRETPLGEEIDGGNDHVSDELHDFYDDNVHGWPGDGSGEDDFADYNQNEADDYRDE